MDESFALDRAAQLLEAVLANGYSKYFAPDVRRILNAEIDRLLLRAIEVEEMKRARDGAFEAREAYLDRLAADIDPSEF